MSEYRFQHPLHAARRGAALFQSARQRQRARSGARFDPTRSASSGRRSSRRGGPTIYISDWRQRNATFFTALQVERNVMFLILTLIILVAALNIISGLIMLVKDKGRDIAILRTMGATRAARHAHLLHHRRQHRHRRHAGWASCWACSFCANIESIRKFFGWLTDTELFSPEHLLSLANAGRDGHGRSRPPWWSWRSCCRSWPRSIRPGAPSRLDPVEALRYE